MVTPNPFDGMDLDTSGIGEEIPDLSSLTQDQFLRVLQKYINSVPSRMDMANKVMATINMMLAFDGQQNVDHPTTTTWVKVSHHEVQPDIILSSPVVYHGVLKLLGTGGHHALHIGAITRQECEDFHHVIDEWWKNSRMSYHVRDIHIEVQLGDFSGYRYDIHKEPEDGIMMLMDRLEQRNKEDSMEPVEWNTQVGS